MDHEQLAVKVMFDTASAAEKTRAVVELRAMFPQWHDDILVDLEKPDVASLDVGSVLVCLCSAPAIVAIAAGLRTYLEKRPAQQSSIIIKTAEGDEVIATGKAASALDPAKLVDALRRSRDCKRAQPPGRYV